MTREPAHPLELSPGVWQLPVAFDGGGLHHVFSYLIEDDRGGVHLIDPGPAAPESWRTLESGLAAAGHSVEQVRSVLLTHLHHDHAGAAARVRERSGARVLLHERDASWLHRFTPYEQCLERMPAWGVPADRQAHLRQAVRVWFEGRLVREPADGVIVDGDILDIPGRRIEAVWTPGHTGGHLVFADAETAALFTGDHLLPRITPGIGLGVLGEDNPLDDYLRSLARLTRFEEFRAHPGHEHSFDGVGHRRLQIRDRHLRRSELVRELLEESPRASVWQLAEALPWSHGWASVRGHHVLSALVQTEAHLDRVRALRCR